MFFNMFEIMEGLFSVVFIIVAVTIAATAVMSLRAAKRQYDKCEKAILKMLRRTITKQKQIKNRRFARFAERPLMKTMKNAHIAEQEYSTKNSIFA